MRPSTNACSFLASSYSAFSREVAVFLGVVDALGDSGPTDVRPSPRAPRGASRGRPWRGRWACCSRSVPAIARSRSRHDRVVGQLITKRTPGTSRAVRAPEGPSRTRMVVGAAGGCQTARRGPGQARQAPSARRQPALDALQRASVRAARRTAVSSPAMEPATSGQRARSSAAAMAWAEPGSVAQDEQQAGLVDLERQVGQELAETVLARCLGLDEARRQAHTRCVPSRVTLTRPSSATSRLIVAWVVRKPRSRSAAASSCWVRIGRWSTRSRICSLAELLHHLHGRRVSARARRSARPRRATKR